MIETSGNGMIMGGDLKHEYSIFIKVCANAHCLVIITTHQWKWSVPLLNLHVRDVFESQQLLVQVDVYVSEINRQHNNLILFPSFLCLLYTFSLQLFYQYLNDLWFVKWWNSSNKNKVPCNFYYFSLVSIQFEVN